MPKRLEQEINRAAILGTQLEHLVYKRAEAGKLIVIHKNDDLLMAHWSLLFQHCKGVVCLLHHELWSPAFALFRPITEVLLRACVVTEGTDEQVLKIREDEFRADFSKDGAAIDKALGTGTRLEGFLKETRFLMHSLTHSGTAQLGMHFDAGQIGPNVSDGKILALLRHCSNAAFLMTILIAKHYGMSVEAEAANELFSEYGKENAASVLAGVT
jgi:hypothetical protein